MKVFCMRIQLSLGRKVQENEASAIKRNHIGPLSRSRSLTIIIRLPDWWYLLYLKTTSKAKLLIAASLQWSNPGISSTVLCSMQPTPNHSPISKMDTT